MGDRIHIDLVMGRTLVFVVGLEGDHVVYVYRVHAVVDCVNVLLELSEVVI